jgi:hypothetical protein
MDTSCAIDSSQIYTLQELKDDYPGGFIHPIGELPTLDKKGNLDPAWLDQTITTLYRYKVLPKLIPPQYPTFATPPPLPSPPQLPPASPPIPPECGMAGRPSPDGNIRLYTQDECNSLNGNWYANGECIRKTGGSFSAMCGVLNKSDGCGTYGFPAGNANPIRMYGPDDCKKVGGVHKPWDMCYKDENIVAADSFSVKCAYLNNPSQDNAKLKYEQDLTNYQNALQSIATNKKQYNDLARAFNEKNEAFKAAMKTEYCFYANRLSYTNNSFIKTTADPDVHGNDKMVNYKYQLMENLRLKMLILTSIASKIYQNNVSLIEGFQGSMPRSDSDLKKQHNTLTDEITASKLNNRMVDYTLEKNKAHQNLLTLFGVLNVVAIGIIYGIASS